MSFYIVLDSQTAWGVGQTFEDALKEATQWIPDSDGTQGCSLEYLKSMIISEAASKNGESGFFVAEIPGEYPENAEELDGEALCRLWWAQQEKSN